MLQLNLLASENSIQVTGEDASVLDRRELKEGGSPRFGPRKCTSTVASLTSVLRVSRSNGIEDDVRSFGEVQAVRGSCGEVKMTLAGLVWVLFNGIDQQLGSFCTSCRASCPKKTLCLEPEEIDHAGSR
jgi:hypothetical protein